jgi:hypothetical protein
MAKLLSSTTDSTNDQIQQTTTIHSTDNNETIRDTSNDVKILSSHPRFLTLKIVQNFPHIQHRFCHKIKVSIPWTDTDSLPNEDTYYQAICYFFDMVKEF